MAVFSCKMCGGSLEISGDMTVAECEYCGTKQTLPKLDNDKKANLYDRANHFRRSNEYDKAAAIFEQILEEEPTDPESYWSLVLCRYGIEYVEDPATKKRVPTVNRAQYASVLADDDYKSALKFADEEQRKIYENDAKTIDEIQKGIIAISQNEEPFDVFICYKETDANGRRTPDSVLANELYHQLTNEGFKVFFARITLEDKLGSAYEPYIFAALNSAKVMVVLGTKPEYFNAVWVKNEWSRYLALIRGGANKVLIPAYKDMDPYDLPEEFSHLQAQDMAKLGFMQDLIRGIEKIASPEKAVGKTVIVQSEQNSNVTALLDRGFMALEDSEWSDADNFFEQALNLDAKNANAYLGKLMAELKLSKEEDFKECEKAFHDSKNFAKVIRFGDDALKRKVQGYADNVKNNLAYRDACNELENARKFDDFEVAAAMFERISGYRDAEHMVEVCHEKLDEKKEGIYQDALQLIKDSEETRGTSRKTRLLRDAIDIFRRIPDWKNSAELVNECEAKIKNIWIAEKQRMADEAKAAKRRKIAKFFTFISVVGIVALAVLAYVYYVKPMMEEKQRQEIIAEYKNLSVGDTISFGKYNDKDIFWDVLDKTDGKLLLVSTDILIYKPYDSNYSVNNLKWVNSDIRKWLNAEFANAVFSSVEKEYICETKIDDSVRDDLFLLSIEEYDKYFGTKSDTDIWWLRGNYDSAYITASDGLGHNAYRSLGIRPAMWIEVK